MTETSSSPQQAATAVTLSDAEREQVTALTDELLLAAGGKTDSPAWTTAARTAAHRLPLRLRSELREFRHDPGPEGVLLVRNLPVGADLPPTPVRPGSVQRTASTAAASLITVMLQLGEVIAYRNEKLGALVQDVVPVPGLEEEQSNAGSTELHMHTENAFHPNRPHFVGLLCVRADPTGQARLCTSAVRQALPLLSPAARNTLSEERFLTEAPPSFGSSDAAPPAHAVLSGAPEDPDILVDFASTHALDGEARGAMVELQRALEEVVRPHELAAGELAVVDNRMAVHGRTSYTPRYDGTDRWLHRVHTLLDRRRARPDAVEGGAVLR